MPPSNWGNVFFSVSIYIYEYRYIYTVLCCIFMAVFCGFALQPFDASTNITALRPFSQFSISDTWHIYIRVQYVRTWYLVHLGCYHKHLCIIYNLVRYQLAFTRSWWLIRPEYNCPRSPGGKIRLLKPAPKLVLLRSRLTPAPEVQLPPFPRRQDSDSETCPHTGSTKATLDALIPPVPEPSKLILSVYLAAGKAGLVP